VGADERFMELYDASRETDFQRMMTEVLYQYEWTDYEDFMQKYGPRTNADAWSKIQSLAQYFEGIGVMVQTASIDLDQVSRLLSNQIIPVWDKLDEVIIEQRRRDLNPTIYQAFESLYYAIKNYQQTGPSQPEEVQTHKFDD
jgi:hypothetical protein